MESSISATAIVASVTAAAIAVVGSTISSIQSSKILGELAKASRLMQYARVILDNINKIVLGNPAFKKQELTFDDIVTIVPNLERMYLMLEECSKVMDEVISIQQRILKADRTLALLRHMSSKRFNRLVDDIGEEINHIGARNKEYSEFLQEFRKVTLKQLGKDV